MRITVLAMNAGSKLMTTTPIASDDSGICLMLCYMRITVLVMNAGSKTMTASPVISDDGGIGKTLACKLL